MEPVSAEMLEWLRGRFATWNEGGPDAMFDVWHPDIVWYDPPDFPDAGVARGAAAVAEHLALRLEALGKATVTAQAAWHVPGEDDLVLVELNLSTGGRTSGMELRDVPLFHATRIRDGRTLEVREYLKREQALEALGAAG